MNALDGIRILDLTRLLPGPFATLVLADLGAQVDKLEDPSSGDYLRHTPPVVGDQAVAFHALNRGKRSLALDLKRPEGAQAFRKLVKNYDVVFEQFRPGVLGRLGLGHDTMLLENPRLIVCALTGYGQSGPLRDRAGHDLNYMARAGLMGLQGPAEDKPALPAFQLADVSGGMWCVIAILAALRERELTGRGRTLDIAMFDSVIPFATITLSKILGGETVNRGQELLTGGIAPYQTYRTKDDAFITLAALEPKFLMRFCGAVGLEIDMTALMPGPHQHELQRRFADVFSSRTRAEWQQFNEQHDCCLEPVLEPNELRADPHVKARNLFPNLQLPEGEVGVFRTPVTPAEHPLRPGPRQGEHSREILREAGFDAAELDTLARSGALPG
ncbi:MAG: CaiB/BaiF CoA-transferase family protein [Polyangiaceae bacterium]